MTKATSRIVSVMATGLLIAGTVGSPAQAARPKCFGQRATIVARSGDALVKGTGGDDVIVGTAAADYIVGKGGNDLICGRGGDDYVLGGGGNDKLNGGPGLDLVLGQAGKDKVLGAGDGDSVSGGPGNDTVNGGGGANDFIDFSVARSGIQLDLGAGTSSGEGTDSITSVENSFGSAYDDTLVGDSKSNFLVGGAGNDVITGSSGLDILEGDAGDDEINGGDDSNDPTDTFDGIAYWNSDAGVDVDLEKGTGGGGAEGSDEVLGVEFVIGSDYNDKLTGDGNDNYFFGQEGDDTINGAGGFDYGVFWFSTMPVNADLAAGTATGQGSDRLDSIEGLFGSIDNNDVLTGDGEDNYLDGDGGDDSIQGGPGDDWLLGGAGDDQINGGAGTYDLADYFADASIQANLVAGTATGEGNDTLAGIEAVGGADHDDVLIGDSAVNYLLGYGGNDQIRGGGGDDFLDGGAGTDDLDGEDGTDNCYAGETALATCEGSQAPPPHPLQPVVDDADTFRRNF